MTTLLEAARQALALNAWTHFGECRATDGPIPTPAEVDAALRQAIEQAEKQEPVAWINWNAATGERTISFVQESELASEPLYTSPPPRQPWVGLTDEDKQIAFDDTQEGGGFWEFADAIEATLRKKNHG